MFNAILCIFRVTLMVLAGSEQIALENLALRQQMAIFQRTVRRPKIRSMDRLFWICLRKMWKDWKSALVIVQPETVLGWQRKSRSCRGTRVQADLGPPAIFESLSK